jgi:hypothetical protein
MELVNWLFANHPFLPKKKTRREIANFDLILESISAFQLRKTHFVSNLGSFLVTLPSFAQHAFCTLIFSSKLPTVANNLHVAWFSLLLVQFSTNSINLVSTFALVLSMASFSLNLAQYSTIFIS